MRTLALVLLLLGAVVLVPSPAEALSVVLPTDTHHGTIGCTGTIREFANTQVARGFGGAGPFTVTGTGQPIVFTSQTYVSQCIPYPSGGAGISYRLVGVDDLNPDPAGPSHRCVFGGATLTYQDDMPVEYIIPIACVFACDHDYVVHLHYRLENRFSPNFVVESFSTAFVDGQCVEASGPGPLEPPTLVGVNPTGDAEGDLVAVSGTGEARTATQACVSAVCLQSGGVAASAFGAAEGGFAASGTGDATANAPASLCVSPALIQPRFCINETGVDPNKAWLAVSGTGRAEGNDAVSLCNLVDALCVDPL